jgi:hypothetical protein
MKLDKLIQDEKLRRGAAVFASSYAKRMLESRYDHLMETSGGRKLKDLNRPTKLGIEAALNLLAGYLATKEATQSDPMWKQVAYEILSDAPSEFSKRLLNGQPHGQSHPSDQNRPVHEASETALEAFRQLKPDSLEHMMAWLRSSGEADRQQFADYLAGLVHRQQPAAPECPSPSSAGGVRSQSAQSATGEKVSASLLSDVARTLGRINDHIESRRCPSNKEPAGEN